MPQMMMLPHSILHATSVTLLHSLWQGAVIAAVICLITFSNRNMSASKRYNLLLIAMLVFCCAATYTFLNEFLADGSEGNILVANDPHTSQERLKFNGDNASWGIWSNIISLVRSNGNAIVWLWLSIVCLKTLQMAAGVSGVRRLKRSAFDIDVAWTIRTNELAQLLGVSKAVKLAGSAMAQVPMVIGHFKPVILMPVGLLTALSTAEVEAILVHELAHIYRRDYLVNLLLCLVEILFFFNPAILWLATLVREGREHCCDDIAVQVTGSKTAYIKALVSCEEYHQIAPKHAMAFSKRKGLLVRVDRLLSGARPTLGRTERSLVALCLLGGTLIATAFTHHHELSKATVRVTKVITVTERSSETVSSTVPAPVALKDAVPTRKKKAMPEPSRSPDTLKKLPTLNDNARLADLDAQQAELKRLQAEMNKQQRISQTSYQAEYQAWNDEYNRNIYVPVSPVSKLNVRLDPIKQPLLRIKTGVKATLDGLNNEPPIILNDEDAAKDVAGSLAKAMVAESLATNVKSFKMTADELVVNARKLSDEDFMRFREKYVRSFHQGTTIYYNYSVN